MSNSAYKKIHVVINPASGKNEPIINVLNDVFHQYDDVDWNVSVTKKYGDATAQAREAVQNGAELVAGYGGDGTQHEIANGIMGTTAVMGVLPGGTGNGFATELGTPKELKPAVQLLCTGGKVRNIDVVKLGDSYFIQRLYVGIEPEEQTSREDKDKYGTFAYAINAYHRARDKKPKEFQYKIVIDGEEYNVPASKLYVVNAAKAGTGISVTGKISEPDDGLLEVFILDNKSLKSLVAAGERMIHLDTKTARKFIKQGKEIYIDTDPDQPVWTDGEYTGRTPISMQVVPGALKVVVPNQV
ncbi:MAG: diacylglycerol kinase family lipid kinase [Chloroflexi bacterium]|nr:diacylglycerol kinase family lipid kinase [Chloroflexota bacterium]MBP7043871.1 diacylglycerol kinase family lipid kinase [Chloroflexota bacterium]